MDSELNRTMDGQIPNPPNIAQTQPSPSGDLTSSPIPPKETPHGKKGLLFAIVFVVIVLILFLGTLNYINILKLSELFPNYLGFLPKREVPVGTSLQPASPASPRGKPTGGFNNSTIKQLKLSCPSIKEFCERGQGIIKDGKYIGWGSVLASGSAIFATFDGDLTATNSAYYSTEIEGKTVEQRFKILSLDNPTLNLKAIYYLKGAIIKTGKVKKGEQIAISNGKTISIYDNHSLIFSLIPGYTRYTATEGQVITNPVGISKEFFE